MKKTELLEYLTGFLMGATLGFMITGVVLGIYNLTCRWWLDCGYLPMTWWNAIPLPLILGFSMARIIANLKLGDY
jgi:hypothetical protein